MKQVEFDESELDNLDLIAKQLFSDEDDPASWNYKRVLIRPEINWKKVLFFLFLPFVIILILYFVFNFFEVDRGYSCLFCAIVFVFYWLSISKKAVICVVRIYQRFAPDRIREKCRFEPSCSQYMVLAIEKYGLLKGLIKGVERIKRCNTDNGGYDYP